MYTLIRCEAAVAGISPSCSRREKSLPSSLELSSSRRGVPGSEWSDPYPSRQVNILVSSRRNVFSGACSPTRSMVSGGKALSGETVSGRCSSL